MIELTTLLVIAGLWLATIWLAYHIGLHSKEEQAQ
jgi:hypothetical protein